MAEIQLGVEGFFGRLRRADERQALRNFLVGGREDYVAVAQYDYSVIKILQFRNGVGGDNYGLVLICFRSQKLLKGGFRLEIEGICRFVEKEILYSEGQHVSQLGFLAVTRGGIFQRFVTCQAERLKIAAESLMGESGIKWRVGGGELADGLSGKIHIFFQQECTSHTGGSGSGGVCAVEQTLSLGRGENPSQYFQQSGLSRTVLSYKEAYAGSEGAVEVFKCGTRCPAVSERKIFESNHISGILMVIRIFSLLW